VKQDPKDKLQSPDAAERMSQEMDELLAASKRLLAELQDLTERAKALSKSRQTTIRAPRRRN
jgi:prefoldin subunit 5